jgi:hypothetical protein
MLLSVLDDAPSRVSWRLGKDHVESSQQVAERRGKVRARDRSLGAGRIANLAGVPLRAFTRDVENRYLRNAAFGKNFHALGRAEAPLGVVNR